MIPAERINRAIQQEQPLTEREGPLTVEELVFNFPHMHRKIPPPSRMPEVFTFTPQPGEMSRYGVYFWAVSDKFPPRLEEGKYSVLVDTGDLFENGNIDERLMARGIVTIPSPYYESLYREYAASHPGQSPLEVDCMLHRKHMILDLATAMIRGTAPIFSIPSEVVVHNRQAVGSAAYVSA